MKHRRGIDLVAPIQPARHREYEPLPGIYETLAGLRDWEVLGAKCSQCGRIAWLDKGQVMKRCGNQYLRNLPDRLVCGCGNGRGNRVGTIGRD